MLRIENLCVDYTEGSGRTVSAVRALSLEAGEGRVLSLLGPSGCGKTTTLRAIAGLLRPTLGRIEFQHRTFFCQRKGIDLPAVERRVGFMFQSYAIWPHMTVQGNVAFPLTVGQDRPPREQVQPRSLKALERLHLEGLANRRATELSGGQQQRLALARALVHEPKLLLLDEPLSNLEPSLRVRMTQELRELQRETGLTMVLVTHDHTEAMALSDEIAVLRDGALQQLGSPREVYQRPCNPFVAQFLGQINLVPEVRWNGSSRQPPPTVHAGTAPLAGCSSPMGDLLLSMTPRGDDRPGATPWAASVPFTVGIRPEDIHIHGNAPDGAGINWFPTTITRTTYLGERLEVRARVQSQELVARCRPFLDLREGQAIWMELPPIHCLRFASSVDH